MGVALVLIISILAVAPVAAQVEKRIALLIGNQAYDTSVGKLRNPHNDIAVVGQALGAQGFELIPPIKDARRSTILGGVRELVRRLNAAGAGAIGFIYYSGHGAAEKDTNINYLIPVDAREPGTTTFWDESLKLDDVLRLLDGARGAAKFVVFDACRNELQLPSKDTSKGLIPIAEQQGMFIAYASAPGRTASDRGESSGPYAAALAAELAKPGLDHLNLFQNVKEAVLASTGGAQQPWESNGLGRRVYLTGQAKLAEPALPWRLSEAAEAWAAVKDTTSIAALETFIARFKDTYYGDLARLRIDELKKQQFAVAVPPKAPGPAPLPKPAVMVPPTSPPARCDGVEAQVGNEMRCLRPKAAFKDCETCPEMVVVPAGNFTMGSPRTEEGHNDKEEPQHKVTIAKSFAAGKYAVTFDEWDACVSDGGCNDHRPSDQGWGRSKLPVINVSWDDAKTYTVWLSAKTGKTYRLLSEAEREYVARAGSSTAYWLGSTISANQANFNPGYGKGENRRKAQPVDSFAPNSWGLYNVHGNVWEWVEDCWHNNYQDAPLDGSAWTTGECKHRILRGGSWVDYTRDLRSAARTVAPPFLRGSGQGFRLARTL
jgi:formylglycine-generating enzyme required for sulfatase activity